MKIRQLSLFIFLICATLLMTACGGETNVKNGNQPDGTEPPVQEENKPVLALEKGEIVSINNNSVLVTAFVDKGDSSYVNAYSLSLHEKTEIVDHNGKAVTSSELVVGAQVEAWYSGPVQESFPARATAAKLVLLTNEHDSMNIDRSEAVRIALEAQTELNGPWAVIKAEPDAAKDFWNVELVQFQYVNQPVKLRINAKTGAITPVPKAENDAFRVYTPMPDEELGNEFVIEGEARVFEGAFSWSLEDGHHIYAEGEALAEAGAPEWGRFQIEVKFDHAVQSNMMLVLYVKSAKDGTFQHTLAIPLKVQEQHIKVKTIE